MAQPNYQFSDLGHRAGMIEPAPYTLEHSGLAVGPALRYSSPKPWLLAIAISSAMWVGIGWAIWSVIR